MRRDEEHYINGFLDQLKTVKPERSISKPNQRRSSHPIKKEWNVSANSKGKQGTGDRSSEGKKLFREERNGSAPI